MEERLNYEAAVFKEKGKLVVEEVPDPKPEADEIILKVKYCAICGSDLHRYDHGMMSPGLIMGHEYAGEVVEVGKNVKGFKTGDRLIRCTGQPNPGREFINVPPRFQRQGERVWSPEARGLCPVCRHQRE